MVSIGTQHEVTWPTNTPSQVQFLGKVLHDLEDWSPNPGPFLISPLTTIKNQLWHAFVLSI